MNKIKLFIVLTLLTLSVLLLPNLKQADASTKQDYVLTAPPSSYEVMGEMFEVLSIEYYITYYDTDNLYYLNDVVLKINDSIETLIITSSFDNYLPSDINFIGLYFKPAYSNVLGQTTIDVDLYYKSSIGDADNLLKENFITLNNLNHYLEDLDCFYMCYTDISSQYNLGYENGKKDTYIDAYNKGYQEGLAVAENDFFSLFTGIADTPFMIITSLLSFEIFGVNAFVVLFSILTICIIIWLIKKFMV